MKREFKDLIRLESYECLNSEITGAYDEAHAVKCVNGTFVGTEEHGVASWLGIPFAKPPVGDAVPYVKKEDMKYYEEFHRVCRFQEPGLIETEFMNDLMFRVPMLQQLDAQSAFNKTFCYYWSYPGSDPDVGAAHSVELMFEFNDRGQGTNSSFNGTNNAEEIFQAVQQMWTNFARCGDPSTDQIEWKAYSLDDQNVLDIAGPGDIRIKQGLLTEQYKAVLPLDVAVIIRIVVTMAAIRSKELGGDFGGFLVHRDGFGVCNDHAALNIHLRVRAHIADLQLAGLLVQHERAVECGAYVGMALAASDSGKAGDEVLWTLKQDGSLVIYGSGSISKSVPWSYYDNDIISIEVSEGVTSLPDDAFYGCQKAASLTLPSS